MNSNKKTRNILYYLSAAAGTIALLVAFGIGSAGAGETVAGNTAEPLCGDCACGQDGKSGSDDKKKDKSSIDGYQPAGECTAEITPACGGCGCEDDKKKKDKKKNDEMTCSIPG